ncbi:MAG: tetratricopeptide repeat protein [Methylotenera sp.]|nr:tetratricopeptide repeat protein [Methylotenera sp.]
MSLINQMLKDLEQRGAGSTDAEKIIISRLDAVTKPNPSPLASTKLSSSFLKISGLMVLLTGGTYLWVQSAPAQSHNADSSNKVFLSQPANGSENAISATKSEGNTLANAIIDNPVSAPLFEVVLKHTPVAAQMYDNNPGKKEIVASIQLANFQNKSALVKPTESVKSSEFINPSELVEPTNLIAPERILVAPKILPQSATNNKPTGKHISQEQKSGNFYRQALANLQQGRVAEAQENLSQALEANPANQDARQTLAGLLLDNKRNDEARTTLAAGLAIAPEQSNFRIALARLQIEAGDRSGALNTLEQGAAYGKNNADYQSFLATMLQRVDRHEEAINHYNTALSLNSSAASSLVGLGISLQAVGKLQSAHDTFTRAQSNATLSPELSQFVDLQLKLINQHGLLLSP